MKHLILIIGVMLMIIGTSTGQNIDSHVNSLDNSYTHGVNNKGVHFYHKQFSNGEAIYFIDDDNYINQIKFIFYNRADANRKLESYMDKYSVFTTDDGYKYMTNGYVFIHFTKESYGYTFNIHK